MKCNFFLFHLTAKAVITVFRNLPRSKYKMKYNIFILLIFLWSCTEKKNSEQQANTNDSYVTKTTFQTILDTANVHGAILIYDSKNDKYYSNDFEEARSGYVPASTFKIPNSIIGLENGIIENEETVFKWDGNERALSIWEKDLTLKEAFQASCVPCYQELADKIGVERMNEHLEKLNFGKMDVHPENLNTFWLIGDSRINPFEQIDFLIRFYNSQLPISTSTTKIVKNIMKMESGDDYSLSGKTGWAIRDGLNTGWFVGYVERDENVYYFATKIRPNEGFDMSKFTSMRKTVTKLALKEMGIIN